MSGRLVVVGGDAAGMSAASQARRMDRDLEIVAFERSGYGSYSACGEPYYVAGIVDSIERLVARTPERFAHMGIDLRTRHEVEAIDLDRRLVRVADLEGGSRFEMPWDQLMVSTGAHPLRPASIAGIDLPGVLALRTLEDAVTLRAMTEHEAERVVVVGAGYIGLEMAEALAGRGAHVTIVTLGPHVLEKTLDPEMGRIVDDAVRDAGVELLTDTTVDRIVGDVKATGVAAGDALVPADLVFLGLGTAPDVALAEAAGIPLGVTGAIAVDDRQRTRVEGVWSAGDCAETVHRVNGQAVNIHLGTIANKTGRIAGTNIGGGDARFPGVLGTAIVKVFDLEVACTGLNTAQSAASGFDPVVGIAKGRAGASYWPDAAGMVVSVIADRVTGRVLGGQVVGGEGTGKRIDALATAIWKEATLDDLAWADLAYAPPFTGVWDLINIASRNAADP
jgi:NADPH-dependent 2,4-dienoyl-CoA reductase/sulfur reductase-like enzyme